MTAIRKHFHSKEFPECSTVLLFAYCAALLSGLLLRSSYGLYLRPQTAAVILLLVLLITSGLSSSVSAAVLAPALTAVCGFASASLFLHILGASGLRERAAYFVLLLLAVPYQFLVSAIGTGCAEMLRAVLIEAGKGELTLRRVILDALFLMLSLLLVAAVIAFAPQIIFIPRESL